MIQPIGRPSKNGRKGDMMDNKKLGTLSSSGIVAQGVDTKLIYGFNDVSFISGIWKDFHKDDLDGL